MLKQTLSTIVCASILSLSASGQNAGNKKAIAAKDASKTSVTFSLQKIVGIGPSGYGSVGIGSFDPYENEGEYKAYPKMKNKPLGLQNAVSYFYMLDKFQFYYQNYCAGVYSKEFFLDKAAEQKWQLSDTLKLSKKSIKCGISVMAGLNAANDLVYVVDANNNGDFGDDVLRPALETYFKADLTLAASVYTEYAAGKEIKSEQTFVIISGRKRLNDDDKLQIMFSFPEIRYARVEYKGEAYFIIAERGVLGETISVMLAVPNFITEPNGSGIKINQFVKIGDGEFKFIASAESAYKITLTGNDISGFSEKQVSTIKAKSTSASPTLKSTVSSQLGFIAPIVKGKNINPLSKKIAAVSTANLKGKYILVDFWSSFCPPCIAEFPYLRSAYDKFDRSKFEIVGVLDERDQSVTKRLIGEGVMTWPTIVTQSKDTEAKGYNVNSYPTSYLIDPQGKIIAMNLRGDDLMNKLNTLISKN